MAHGGLRTINGYNKHQCRRPRWAARSAPRVSAGLGIALDGLDQGRLRDDRQSAPVAGRRRAGMADRPAGMCPRVARLLAWTAMDARPVRRTARGAGLEDVPSRGSGDRSAGWSRPSGRMGPVRCGPCERATGCPLQQVSGLSDTRAVIIIVGGDTPNTPIARTTSRPCESSSIVDSRTFWTPARHAKAPSRLEPGRMSLVWRELPRKVYQAM